MIKVDTPVSGIGKIGYIDEKLRMLNPWLILYITLCLKYQTFIIYICMSILFLCMYVYHVSAWYL